MHGISHVFDFVRHEILFLTWRDYLEIALFSSAIYYFLRWLSYDKQKNLVTWFYGYCLLALGSYMLELTTLNIILLISSPIVFMLFLLVHERTLQKNFICLKNITPQKSHQTNWLEIIMQVALSELNKGRSITYVIEKNSTLSSFLSTRSVFNTQISKDILELLLTTAPEKTPVTFWITTQGVLIGINPEWHIEYDKQWLDNEIQTLEVWQQHAIIVTKNSDALLFKTARDTRRCTIIVEGKQIENLSIKESATILAKLVGTNHSKPGEMYAYQPAKNSSQQERT